MTAQEPDTIGTVNPFQDPVLDTLTVARGASLTLGTDSLVVLDEGLAQLRKPTCCGLLPTKKTLPTRTIPYFNVLWAELAELDLIIHHASPVSKNVVRASYISYIVDKDAHAKASAWIERLLQRSYGTSQRRKRIKLLINPFGGSGKAQKWYLRDIEPIFAAARCQVDVERTQYSGHAMEIAEKLDTDAYDVIACCSGDGVPYEVFNGLGKKRDASRALAKVAVVQLPCGTGNAMSWNMNGTDSTSLAAMCVVKGLRTPLDLISVTQGSERTLSFLSQSVGIVAETDLGTENIRWMGDARFTYGFLVRLIGKTVYPADIAIKVVEDDKSRIKSRYQQHIADGVSPEDSQLNRYVEPSSSGADPALDSIPSEMGLPPLKYGTVQDPLPAGWNLVPYPTLGNFYSGNMSYMASDANFFQAALPSDGCLDLLCIDGRIGRLAAVQTLLAVASGKLFGMPHVSYRKVEGYRIIPHQRDGKDGLISIDGERVPFEPFQVEVHRGLGTVLSRSGKNYEAPPLL